MNTYVKNVNWTMFVEDKKLFITKGADEVYYLDEVKEEHVSAFHEAYCNDAFNSLPGDAGDVVEKLVRAGVIYKKKFEANEKALKVAIKYFGTPPEALIKDILGFFAKRKHSMIVDAENGCDVLLMIRVNVPLKNLLENYACVTVPHLLIDLGYAKTISLGPLVHKGETACLGCFIGRLAKNWGDPIPPIEPNITLKPELVASFILEKMEAYAKHGNCPDLVNGAWNFNVATFNARHDKVYKLPWCPVCQTSADNPKMDLPWINELRHD